MPSQELICVFDKDLPALADVLNRTKHCQLNVTRMECVDHFLSGQSFVRLCIETQNDNPDHAKALDEIRQLMSELSR